MTTPPRDLEHLTWFLHHLLHLNTGLTGWISQEQPGSSRPDWSCYAEMLVGERVSRVSSANVWKSRKQIPTATATRVNDEKGNESRLLKSLQLQTEERGATRHSS